MNADGGQAKVETINGTLTVNNSVNAANDILLAAGGAGNNVVINAAVTSQNGAITLLAAESVLQNNNLSVAVGADAILNSIYVRAIAGAITMSGTAISSTQGGNIYYEAATSVTLGSLQAGAGLVAVTAGTDILDGQNDTVTHAAGTGLAVQTGDPRVENILASGVRLESGDSIGAVGNPLDLTVTTVAATAADDIYLYETTH